MVCHVVLKIRTDPSKVAAVCERDPVRTFKTRTDPGKSASNYNVCLDNQNEINNTGAMMVKIVRGVLMLP